MQVPGLDGSMRGVLAAALLCGIAASAQTQPPDSFEDLARRAEALVDAKPSEAADLYRKALAIRPEWAEGWLYLGGSLYASNRFAEATDAFRKGTKLAPSTGSAWAFLGLCEAALDDPDQAIADIRKGEEFGIGDNWPFEVFVRTKAAQTLIRSSLFDEALAQLVPLAQRNENSAEIQATMGLCALAIPSALADLPADRRAVVAMTGKAAWTSASHHPAEAAAAYRELMARYPEESGVHYAYGLYLMETDLAAALAEFQKELRNSPKHWPTMIVAGGLYTRQGTADAALEVLQQALKTAPPKYRWMCHAELGRAHMTAGHMETAVAEFESAVRLMPGNAQAHFFLSQAYRRAGRKEDAQRETAEFEKLKIQQDPLGVPGFRGFTFGGGR
jgi:tetratricopeptide (TPR) repeat protein